MRQVAAGLLAVLALAAAGPVSARSAIPDPWPAPPAEIAPIPVVMLADPGAGRILFASQHGRRFAPASMAKVMSAYVAFQEMARGKLRRDRVFTVGDAVAREWNGKGTSLYLQSGERVTADLLLRGITTVSANDAAVVLATGHAGSLAGWTALMNAEARRLNMADSHFGTANGWPDGGVTYVSAFDLVKLATALIERHPAEYRRYFGRKSLTFHGVTQQNRDPALGVVAGADGIKTGHTNEAGYNFLGSAERSGRRLIMVIAGAGSEAERAAASRALLEWGFSAWQARPLFKAGQRVGQARVQGGNARQVTLVTPRAIHAALPKGEIARITLEIRYNGPLVAPVARGSHVATLEILNNGYPAGAVPLLAGNGVSKAGPIDRLWNGLMGLLS